MLIQCKSTLAVLTKNVLDDEEDLLGIKLLNLIKKNRKNKHYNKIYYWWQEDKYYTLVDLAGHEKYLKTTLLGLSSVPIDHFSILIGANGVSKMTKEHLGIALALKKPLTIILTKII